MLLNLLTLVSVGDGSSIDKMISLFSVLLSELLDVKISIVTIGDEIDYAKIYIDGMPEEKLNEIRKYLNKNTLPATRHIGLCNENQQIKLMYGNAYALTINADSNGTIATMVMPTEGCG